MSTLSVIIIHGAGRVGLGCVGLVFAMNMFDIVKRDGIAQARHVLFASVRRRLAVLFVPLVAIVLPPVLYSTLRCDGSNTLWLPAGLGPNDGFVCQFLRMGDSMFHVTNGWIETYFRVRDECFLRS